MRRFLLFALGLFGGLIGSALAARALIPSRGDETSDELALVVIADSLALRSRASAFRGGRLATWFAGADLDLSEVQLAPGGARLELTTLMSGVAVRLPAGCRVEVEQRGMSQGVALDIDNEEALPPDAPTLTLRVLVVGSGVAVTNRADDDGFD
jgi:hypothetical protein